MTHVSQANSVSTRIVLDDRTFGGFFSPKSCSLVEYRPA